MNHRRLKVDTKKLNGVVSVLTVGGTVIALLVLATASYLVSRHTVAYDAAGVPSPEAQAAAITGYCLAAAAGLAMVFAWFRERRVAVLPLVLTAVAVVVMGFFAVLPACAGMPNTVASVLSTVVALTIFAIPAGVSAALLWGGERLDLIERVDSEKKVRSK